MKLLRKLHIARPAMAALAALMALATVFATAPPASALTATHMSLGFTIPGTDISGLYGFDYNKANNHLRAYVTVYAANASNVSIDGGGYVELSDGGTLDVRGQGTGGTVTTVETDYVLCSSNPGGWYYTSATGIIVTEGSTAYVFNLPRHRGNQPDVCF